MSDHRTPLALVLADTDTDPVLQRLLDRAEPDERRALVGALRNAYEAGQEQAERRTGRFVAQVLQPMLGVAPVEAPPAQPGSRSRLLGRALAGLLGAR